MKILENFVEKRTESRASRIRHRKSQFSHFARSSRKPKLKSMLFRPKTRKSLNFMNNPDFSWNSWNFMKISEISEKSRFDMESRVDAKRLKHAYKMCFKWLSFKCERNFLPQKMLNSAKFHENHDFSWKFTTFMKFHENGRNSWFFAKNAFWGKMTSQTYRIP